MKRHYSDNDKHFGPFTFSRIVGSTIRLMLNSGSESSENPGCHFQVQGFGYSLICELPALVKPKRYWVPTGHYSWATSPDSGYWKEEEREYGFYIFDGHLSIHYGEQSDNYCSKEKRWSCFLPWTQWRFVRFSTYDLKGNHFGTIYGRINSSSKIVEDCPKAKFELTDYDGASVTATTHIEELEWKFGYGWFKWLSWFRKPVIRRSLCIRFNKEVGPNKHEWKGGVVGTGIEMLPDEFHEDAFKRFCDKEHKAKYENYRVQFVRRIENE